MSSIDIAVFKIMCAGGLALTSFGGVVSPVLMIRRNTESLNNIARWLSCANCASAGLLIGVGLMHFLGESIQGAIERNRTPTDDGVHEGVALAMVCLIVGILLPLFVDRVALAALRGASGHHHGHSHGLVHEVEGTLEEGGIVRDESGFPQSTCEETSSGSSTGSRRQGSSGGKSGSPAASPTATAHVVLIAVLLSIHSFMEGATLGLEGTILSLRSAVVPMLIHKFFDGMILGVSVGKRILSQQRHQAPGKKWSRTLMQSLPAMAYAWVAVTPVVMLLTGFLSAPTPRGADPTTNVPSLRGVVVQGIGAGSFLYISLVEILPEEFADAADRLLRFVLVVVGVVFVILLEGAHHH